ncbi:MAG: hypothetical protein OXR73_16455 [Myxococcales bacterium]|nr:hypothetical protein [Myxococcales bacterium]
MGLVLLWAGAAFAYDSLFVQLRTQNGLSKLFPSGKSRARIEDGPLLGFGTERTIVLPDGRLRIDQNRVYNKLRNPETGRVAELPEKWKMTVRLVLSPTLRLLEADTRARFHKSADKIFEDYHISEEQEDLFEVDHYRVVADRSGKHLTTTSYLRGKQTKSDTYDYPADSIPIEIAGYGLAAAIDRKVERFNFDLLLPDGSTHGIRAVVHRTRDLSRFAKGYPIPGHQLRRPKQVAVVEMRLDSPIKYMLFPHRFYFIYAAADPGRLLALWGGEPGDHMSAFRVE